MPEKILIVTFIVYAIYFTMLRNMIFGRVRDLFKWVPEFWQKPIFACSVCMTPYYGSVVYWLIWGNSVREWVIVVISAMGLMAVFVKMFPYADP